MGISIRKAKLQDAPAIHKMLLSSADRQELLPRSLSDIYSHLRDFVVLEEIKPGKIYGCCALAICWTDIAEIRSLFVAKKLRGKGYGAKLVRTCLNECETFGIDKVFTLTYVPNFFAGLGFVETAKNTLPQKIWADCLHCPKFPDCDETAMILTC